MSVGQGVVRQIGDCYQVGDGKEGERRLSSSCGLCEEGIPGLVYQQWLGEWGVERARS